MVQKRKDWASALVPRALPSHAYSWSAVAKKKNKRLLSVYSFLKFYGGKAPGDSGKGKNWMYTPVYINEATQSAF